MGRLVYAMNTSLDGYVADADGAFDFSEPDADVHRHFNRQVQEASALVYGRRLHELMEGHWPAAARREDLPEVEAEFARAYVDTPRVVVSDSLETVAEGVQLVRRADAVEEVTRLREQTDGHVDIGGPTLAAALVDLIDEFQVVLTPAAVGGGLPYFPPGHRLALRLVEQHTFAGGSVLLRYRRES